MIGINEAAKILAVSTWTIRRLILAKKLNAAKIGKQYRLSETDISEFLRLNATIETSNSISRKEI